MPGRACFTSFATLTVFAFGPFVICSPMVCLPLVRVMVSAGTETICTVPSCPMVAGEVRSAVVAVDAADPVVLPDEEEPAAAPGEAEPVAVPGEAEPAAAPEEGV